MPVAGTFNPHFTDDIRRLSGGTAGENLPPAYDGYGKDSIVVIVERATRVELGLSSREEMAGTYPDVESSRPSVAIIEAASCVADRNLDLLQAGKGTPVTATLSEKGIQILDPEGDGAGDFIYNGNVYALK